MSSGINVAFPSKRQQFQKPSSSLDHKSREQSFYNNTSNPSMFSARTSKQSSQFQKQHLFLDEQLNLPPQLKSSQGFFLNENYIGSLKQLSNTPIHLKNQVHQASHSSSQLFNVTKAGENSNNDITQSSTNLSKKSKLSQETVLSSFYKKREHSQILLMPDNFWEQQEQYFLPFRQVWADHEKMNANLMQEYEQKKQEQEQLLQERAKKNQQREQIINSRQSSKFLAESTKNSARESLRSQRIIRTPLNFFYYCSTPEVGENDILLSSRDHFHKHHHQLIDQENKNKQERLQRLQSITRKNDKQKMIRSRLSSNQIISDSKFSHVFDKLDARVISPLVSSRSEKPKEIKINEEHMMSKSKEIELTSIQELELQLCQNRFTQEVYDTKIQSLEQLAREEVITEIEQNNNYADKMNRKTKIYNKRSIAESIDQPNSQQAHFQSGGSRGMQKRAASLVKLNIKSDSEDTNIKLVIQEPQKVKMSISYCWVGTDDDNWRPQPRIGCSLNLVGSFGQQLKILLIGGMSSETVKDVLLIDPDNYTYITLMKFQDQKKLENDNSLDEVQKKKASKDNRSSKIQQNRASASVDGGTQRASASQDVDDLFNKYMYGNGAFSQRYNHTAVEISKRSKLLIFGGETQNFDNSNQGRSKLRPHHRNCLNDLVTFDLETLEWRGHMGRGEVVEARRNHTANMVGNKHMVVIGGLNSEGRALDDCFILDILTFRWVNISVFHSKYVHAFPQGIAFHSACFVSEDETSSNINIFGGNYFQSAHQPSKDAKKGSNQPSFSPTFIKEEGLYIFGGIDTQGNYIRNKMFVLKQNGNPPGWIELPTIGKSPDRRCMHTLSFMFSLSVCVVYGGMFESPNSTKYLDDLNILNLKSLEWIQVILEGPRKPGRAMHSTCVNHKSLIIFGGLNEIGFVKGNIEILELDQTIVSKMKRQQNFSLPQHQLLTHRRLSKLDDTSGNKVGSPNDNEKQFDQLNQESVIQYTSRMKEKVCLIDPEREREINRMQELQNSEKDEIEKIKQQEKWKPPTVVAPTVNILSNSIKNNTNVPNSDPNGTRTYLPLPGNIKQR